VVTPMRCSIAGSGIAARYVSGELRRDEQKKYEQHFFGCSHCAEELPRVRIAANKVAALLMRGSAGVLSMGWLRIAVASLVTAVLISVVSTQSPAATLT
jgi:hypothetical protein